MENKPNYPVPTGLTVDDVRDIAINIVDNFVAEGLVPDCTDTDDQDEFLYQDSVFDTLMHRWRSQIQTPEWYDHQDVERLNKSLNQV